MSLGKKLKKNEKMNHQVSLLDVLLSTLVPLKRNFWFIVLTLLITWTAESSIGNMLHSKGIYEFTALECIVDLYFISVILSLFSRRWRKIFHALIFGFVAAITSIDIFCVYKFKSTITPTMYMLYNETDGRETGEFFNTYVTNDVFTDTHIYYIILIAIIYIIISLPWIWMMKHIGRKKAQCKTINGRLLLLKARTRRYLGEKKSLALRIFGSVLTIGLLATSITLVAFNRQQTFRMLTFSTIGEVEHELTTRDRAIFYCSVQRLVFSMRANALTAKQIDTLNKVRENLKIEGCTFDSPNIVLIIGEAYCRDHSQLYGYEKETTPEQVKMEKSGQLVKFTDVCAPWNLTSYVFKHLMTTYTVGDKGDWCDYPLFCELMRIAGYNVRFLTNEFMSKPGEAVYDFSGGFFINDPVLSVAQFDERNTQLHSFDEELLKDYDYIEKNSKGKNKRGHLTIFHLMGQHVNYSQRYPNTAVRFGGKDYDHRKELTEMRWKNNIACYDNATWYNDYVVGKIVKKFENENTIIIYMPDHGEEVHPVEAPSRFGRFHSAKIDKVLARDEFSIPFWIWCSKKYIASHPDVFAQVKAAANKPYMTDALSHLMLYLSGVQCKYYREDRNILSPKYDTHRKRIIKREADYDEVVK